MDTSIMEEIFQSMRKDQNEGISEQQKDAYIEVSKEMNAMLEDMQEQQSKLKRMSNILDEAGNSTLAEHFQMLAIKMNSELDAIDEMMQMASCIAKLVFFCMYKRESYTLIKKYENK